MADTPHAPTLDLPGCLFMDMDSTLIQCECVDEIADFLGIKPQIAAITQAAMEGKLDFSTSLTQRVALLAGLDEHVLKQVYKERVHLTNGAEQLIQTLHAHHWKVGLVSGGFTCFTDLLKVQLHLDFTLSNTLEIIHGKLTGKILGSIVDAEAKCKALVQQAMHWHIPVEQTVAIGDGANDIPMLRCAAMGIAFHAKPDVQASVCHHINQGGLDQVLALINPRSDIDIRHIAQPFDSSNIPENH